MKKRLKELRLTLNLTLREFGSSLGVNHSAISKLENGTTSLTDQMIKSICNTYNVNENWLRNGTGNMFLETQEEFLTNMAKQYSLSEFDQKLIKAYLDLTPTQRDTIKGLLGHLNDL